jgi:MYXO-CTERM domain-containing protein
LFAALALASGGTSKTDEVDLTGHGNEKGSIDGVTVKCTNTLKDDGSFTIDCKFKNSSTKDAKFVWCMMLDLKSDDRTATINGISGDEYQLIIVTSTVTRMTNLTCKKVTGPPKSASAYHLGCKLITVPAAANGTPGETPVSYPSVSTYVHPAGKKLKVEDFQVSYSDFINLGALNAAGLKYGFDEASCKAVIGQGNNLTPAGLAVGNVDMTGTWVFQNNPMTDPFIASQPIGGAAGTPAYALFSDLPCLPGGFHASVPDLAACPAPTGEAPATRLDLNLFWWRSMQQPESARIPAVMTASPSTSMEGIRLQTDPPTGTIFNVAGGMGTFGTLQLCDAARTDTCHAPSVPEGQRVSILLWTRDPETRAYFYAQNGMLVQDRVPPEVTGILATSPASGTAQFAIEATDATTGPIHAELWYQASGMPWRTQGLQPDVDILEDVHARVFSGTVTDLPGGASVSWFAVISDEVSNALYYGPGTLKIKGGGCGCSAAKSASQPPAIPAIPAGILAIALLLRRKRR